MENLKLRYGSKRGSCKKWLTICLMVFLGISHSHLSFANDSSTEFNQREKIKVKGKVIDAQTGEFLVGVNVYVEGTTAGNITDVNGEFNFVLPINTNELTISYIGYKTQKILVGDQREFKIFLENEVSSIDEVVVTGFQTISRERASGAFGSMDKEVMEVKPVQTTSSLLKGQVAGLDVTDKGVYVRGISTFKGSRSPLIVVDGFPIQGELSDINPNNIESINVLKDAAAASIWGARSGNGVIVITTKKAKVDSKDKMVISLNSWIRFSDKIDLDYANPIANSKDQLAIESFLINEYNKANAGTLQDPSDLTFQNTSIMRTEGEYLEAMKAIGYLSGDVVDQRINELSKINYKDDVNEYLLRHPVYQQHNLSIRGNNKKNNYSFSFLFDENKNNFVGNKDNNLSIDFKDIFYLNDRITLNAALYAKYQKENKSGASLSEIRGLAAYDRLVNPDGTYANNTADINFGTRNHLNNFDFPYDWNYNLLQEVRNRDLKSNQLKGRFQFGINIKIIEGLSFDSKIQLQKIKEETKDWYGEHTYKVRSMINQASRFENGVVSDVYFPKGDMITNDSFRDTESYNFRNQINFKKTFAEKHHIDVIAGTEMIQTKMNYTKLPDVFGASKHMTGTSKLPDMEDALDYGVIGNSTSLYIKRIPGFMFSDVRYFSAYGNLSYTYNDKYTVTGSVRTDASNIVSDDPKYRYTPLWSVGLNWNAVRENFIKELDFFDRLNVRFSYGINANVATSSCNVTTVEYGAGGLFNDYNMYSSFNHGNPDLRWETTKTINGGVDFSIRNSRLFGSIDVYNKKGEDLYYNRTYPSTSGVGNLQVNYAEIQNKGYEIVLGTKIPLADKISLVSKANYSYNKNEITDIENINVLLKDQKGFNEYVKNAAVGDLWAFKYAGYEDGVPYVVANDGTKHPMNTPTPNVTNQDFTLLYNQGHTIAPHILGWTNTINIKDLSLTTIITGKFGHVFSNNSLPFTRRSMVGSSNYNENLKQYLNNEKANDFPSLINASTIGNLQQQGLYTPFLSSFVDDASFIRFNDLIINYNVSRYLRKIEFLDNINIYCNINNLGMIWTANKWDMDPEYPKGYIKPQTTYTFGIKLNIK